ncbi:ParB/RepB/Spo0J family partition protein [Pseudooceanicola sp.]|uniref:ParB/RepB/Spo0J family partition protein n=1 Tax=Pseudooceanicola sp. TaxID=1914328 RepID=UPI002628EAA9|nr:ParB/RepB/Spo0J family partition protein [Pseudooceanicola sp.]MDF1857173.1 ParB/RepB/Spo0J family partition protein [Pseudooceanicola sp.]
MVKRRRLEAPSRADLSKIEEEFRDETSLRGAPVRGIAPIAAVAAESASEGHAESVDQRAARARTEADAARFHAAQASGLLIAELPTEAIDEGAMMRDRMVIDEEAQQELRASIAASGMRLPIEVFEIETDGRAARYGLLSGYRRLHAVRAQAELTESEKYTRIRAIVRPRTDVDAAYVSMVEENEVRAELSHFERGRIAVIAAKQGAFSNTEAAVDKLFATGSKAKRSKVRSFALVFEELGDMLAFPEGLTEKRGLRLAAALRAGAEAKLREALSHRPASDAEAEWALLEPELAEIEKGPRNPSRGGRPRTRSESLGWIDDKTIRTSGGITIRRGQDSTGHVLRFEGKAMDADLMDSLMAEIQVLLEKP